MEATNAYWDRIARSTKTKDTITAMRSWPHWMELRDAHGRSPWMHALLHCAPNKICTQISSNNAIIKMGGADNDGKSLWFYVCQAGARQFNHKLNDHEIQFMEQLKSILPSSTDQRGNGIAIQLLLQASDTKGSPTVLHESVLTHVCETGDPWAGSSEDVTRAAAYWRDLCLHVPGLNAQDGAGGHTVNLADGLNSLVKLHPPTHPDLVLMSQISRWVCSIGYMDDNQAIQAPYSAGFLGDKDFNAMHDFIRMHRSEGGCDEAFLSFPSELAAHILLADSGELPPRSMQTRKPRL